MSKPMGDELDRRTEQAWRGFRQVLADRVAGLEQGVCFSLEVEPDHERDDGLGCLPYVQFLGLGPDGVRAEVSSNRFLDPTCRLRKPARRALAELGWAKPDGECAPNYAAEVDAAHADAIAVLAVRTLREVFGVEHPVFLVHDLELEYDGAPLPVEGGSPALPGGSGEEPLAVMPRDRDHLVELVDSALTPMLGKPPVRDADGDIPVSAGSALVFVRVVEQAPVVRIFAELVLEVSDLERAKFEVAVLNRDKPFAKFLLTGNLVSVSLQLPALPFVPEHLRQLLSFMCEMADEVDDDLATRVGGRRFFEPTDDETDETDACPFTR